MAVPASFAPSMNCLSSQPTIPHVFAIAIIAVEMDSASILLGRRYLVENGGKAWRKWLGWGFMKKSGLALQPHSCIADSYGPAESFNTLYYLRILYKSLG